MATPPGRLSLSFVTVDCSDEMVNDAVSIASALRARGHAVDVAASAATAGPIRAAGFAVTQLAVDRLGRAADLDHWLRASPRDAVHMFGHGGVWSTAQAARRLRVPLYWTVGDQAPASAPPVGVLIAYSAHVGRGLAANRRLRLEHVVIEPARITCAPVPASAIDGDGDDARLALGIEPGTQVIVAACPAEPATISGLEQAAAAVAELRCEGHDVVLLHVGGGLVASRLRRTLERLDSGTSVVPSITADVPRIDVLRAAVAVLGRGRGAYYGMLADRPTLVLGANGYAGDCTTAHVEVLSAYDFTGANVTGRHDRAGVRQLVTSLRPLLEHGADGRVWLGSAWARARVGADVAAVSYETLYLRRRHVPRGNTVALYRYETVRLAAQPLRTVRGLTAARLRSRRPVARARPAAGETLVHVFADAAVAATPATIDLILRLHDAGWISTVVLPTAKNWSNVAHACAKAGAHVEQLAPVAVNGVAALRYGVRMMAALRGHLDRWRAAVLHAHDDAAAVAWALGARASGVPLVWDADLNLPAGPFDRIRLAAASYLVLDGNGSRLTKAQRLPPYHHREPSPQSDLQAMNQAYQELTGLTAVVPADLDAARSSDAPSVVDVHQVSTR